VLQVFQSVDQDGLAQYLVRKPQVIVEAIGELLHLCEQTRQRLAVPQCLQPCGFSGILFDSVRMIRENRPPSRQSLSGPDVINGRFPESAAADEDDI